MGGNGHARDATGVLAPLLRGCWTPLGNIPLDGDLADGTTLTTLQEELPPHERAALGTYALLHWLKSKFYYREPIGDGQAVAATVGEPIEQTLVYEANLALA